MRLVSLFCLLLLNNFSFGQNNAFQYNDKGRFGRTNKFDSIKIPQTYPFDKAKSIKLVSFEGTGGQIEENEKVLNNMPNIRKEIFIKPFKEIEKLNEKQSNYLFDILNNFGYIREPNIIDNKKCYIPRNGILFLDDKNQIFEFIEICFECENSTFGSEKIRSIEKPKYILLNNFFKNVGLKYGLK